MNLNPWTVSRMLAGAPGREAEVEFRSGGKAFRAIVPSNELWGSVKDVLVLEEYETVPQFALRELQGGIVVDAGANVGLYSLKVAPFAEEVISFEPAPRNLRLLRQNLERNLVRNVRVEGKALWSVRDELEFSDRNVGFISHLHGERAGYLVKTAVLDDVVGELGRVDMLKMDIEGAEYDVFLSCDDSTFRRIERLAVEFHIFQPDHTQKRDSILRKLASSGFSVVTSDFSQSAEQGVLRPWRCSFVACNGRRALLYKSLLSLVYGAAPVSRLLKRTIDIGTHSFVFAYRKS